MAAAGRWANYVFFYSLVMRKKGSEGKLIDGHMNTKDIIISQIMVTFIWGILGAVFGVLGVLLSSHIPMVMVGWLFGAVGALTHMMLLALNINLSYWKVGLAIMVVAGCITFPWAPFEISKFVVPMYFVFGCVVYLCVNSLIELLFRSK